MIQKRTITLFVILIALGTALFFSGYIEYQKQLEVQRLVEIAQTGSSTIESDTCFRNGTSLGSCAAVQNTKYSILFGISTALVGVLYFTLLLLVFLLFFLLEKWHQPVFEKTKKVFQVGMSILVVGGVFGAGYFIFLQLVVIKNICTYCTVIDVLMLLVGGLYWLSRDILFE